MKITEIKTYTSLYGRIEFAPQDPLLGFDGWYIYWSPLATNFYRKVGHLSRDKENPTQALARFYIRKSVAEDRGEEPYHYTDTNTDPKIL